MTDSRFEIAVECGESCSGVVVLRAPRALTGIPRAYLQFTYQGTCTECGVGGAVDVIGSSPEDEREQVLNGIEAGGARWIPEATCRERGVAVALLSA